MNIFKSHQGRIIKALMLAALAYDTDLLKTFDVDQVVKEVFQRLKNFPFYIRFSFHSFLILFEYFFPKLWHWFRPFSFLPQEVQVIYLNRWEYSGFGPCRQGVLLIKALSLGVLLRQKLLLEAIGYGAALAKRAKAPFDKHHPILDLPNHLQPRDLSSFSEDKEESCDVIVVGSGAAGAVLAKELAEGGMKVALVEQGTFHPQHNDLAIESVDRLYENHGITGTLGKPMIPIPVGRCLGGTTVINSGTCFRVLPHVLKRWQTELGLSELLDEEMNAAFQRVEEHLGVTPADYKVMSRSNTLIRDLLVQEGYQGAPLLRNVRGCQGSGMCCFGCSTLAKQSVDISYIPKALAAGTVAYTGAHLKNILTASHQRGQVIGIEAEGVQKRKLTLYAPKVILATGSFVTPQILVRHGWLKGNQHLGQHLTVHPAVKVLAEFEEEIQGWEGTPQAYYYDGLRKQGILFEGIFVPPDLAGLAFPVSGHPFVHFLKHYSKMLSYGFLINDGSEGHMVSLPGGQCLFRYSLTHEDEARIFQGVQFLAQLLFKGGAKKVHLPIQGQRFEVNRAADLENISVKDFARSKLEIRAFHPLGTCRMGKDFAAGVCDVNHRVFGVEGLYICDGSVIPTPLGVNPQMTIMALATRLANRLLH